MAGSFTYPPPWGAGGDYSNMPNIYIGNPVNITWTSTPLDSVLWLFKDGDNLMCTPSDHTFSYAKISCVPLLAGNRGLSWNWNVQTPEDYNRSSPIYYLYMRDKNGSALFMSHYLNILPQSEAPASTTTASAVRSSSSASFGAPSNVLPTSITSSSASASTTTSSDTGLSSGTKITIGTAVGVGVPLILVLALIAFFMHKSLKKRRNMHPASSSHLQSTTQPPNYRDEINGSSYNKTNVNSDYQQWRPPQEMADNESHRIPSEMGPYR